MAISIQGCLLPARLILVYLSIYVLIPQFFVKRNIYIFALMYTISILIITLVVLRPTWYYIRPILIPEWTEYNFFSVPEIVSNAFEINRAAILPLLFVFVNFYYNEQQRTLRLEKEQYQFQLIQLRNQIHPHFLFNTLNNLYSLIIKKSDAAEDALLRLSGLMRYMLYEANVPKVQLSKELEYLKNYVDLEKLRLDHSNDIYFSSEMDMDYEISPFILIPFIENAFKHGIHEDTASAITIKIEVIEGILHMLVENPKKKYNIKKLDGPTGVGFTNVTKRLELLYKDKYTLIKDDNESYYKIILTLTLNQPV